MKADTMPPRFPAPYDRPDDDTAPLAVVKDSVPAAPAPEPQAGGSYLRNADGSLTLVQQTRQVSGRAERQAVQNESPKE